jgi:hypothetical protein
MSTIAQQAKDTASEESAVQKQLANIAALGPGVHAIQKDKKGRIHSCIVVGQSRISTALGKAKGLEVARKRADLSVSAEFVKFLKEKVTVVENLHDETITLLEGTEEDNKDHLKESGKAGDRVVTDITSVSEGLVRGLQVLYVKTDGENKTLSVLKGWKADTAEGAKRVAANLTKDDPVSSEPRTPKSESPNRKPDDKVIPNSEITSDDAADFLPKKKSK